MYKKFENAIKDSFIQTILDGLNTKEEKDNMKKLCYIAFTLGYSQSTIDRQNENKNLTINN